MKEKFITALVNLFKVKTIITLAITVIFCILAYKETLPIETTTMVIGMVFTYYFNKDANGGNNNGM